MSFLSLLVHEVTVVNRSQDDDAEDRYGNPTYDEDGGATTPARVRQVKEEEKLINRDTRITEYKVWLPSGTDVLSTSRIVWEGRSHEVIGEPDFVPGRGSTVHHVELTMKRIEG